MRIGLIGEGIIGGALSRWIRKHTDNEVRVYDLHKGIDESFEGVQAIFICLPAPTTGSRDQDLQAIRHALNKYKEHEVPFFVRSTVLPGTCDRLTLINGKPVIAMPEFLTERQADEGFEAHDIICGSVSFDHGGSITGLLNQAFPGKRIIALTNREAELVKYAHNCFGAMKVHYFNIIHKISEKLGADYPKVVEAAMMTGFIEKTHTQVPGPDGKFGYGGKCLPKDLKSFIGLLSQYQVPNSFLRRVEAENELLRTFEDTVKECTI